jgi:hypothetical protein
MFTQVPSFCSLETAPLSFQAARLKGYGVAVYDVAKIVGSRELKKGRWINLAAFFSPGVERYLCGTHYVSRGQS